MSGVFATQLTGHLRCTLKVNKHLALKSENRLVQAFASCKGLS